MKIKLIIHLKSKKNKKYYILIQFYKKKIILLKMISQILKNKSPTKIKKMMNSKLQNINQKNNKKNNQKIFKIFQNYLPIVK